LQPFRGIKHSQACIGTVDGGAELASTRGHAQVCDYDIKGTQTQLFHCGFNATNHGTNVVKLAQSVGHDIGMFFLIFNNEHLSGKSSRVKCISHE